MSSRIRSCKRVVNMFLRIRHRAKQPERFSKTSFGNPVLTGVLSAIEAEGLAADGLLSLPGDSRKTNVHFTHCRTNNPNEVQPHQLTRAQFWEHLCRCFREAYPRAETDTGSILEFGLVVKELHKDAPREEDRSEHHHAATHCSTKFRWSVVRKISADKYKIQLNAVAHETYTTMFCYLRCPTKKKKVHELDAEPFFSHGHPQGDQLKELLGMGEKYKAVRAAKAGASADDPVPVRSQFGVVLNWVTEHGIKRKNIAQLEADAVEELKAGRPQLLDFCKKHKRGLQDEVEYIWSLHAAKDKIQRQAMSRLEVLAEAALLKASAEEFAAKCRMHNGSCQKYYEGSIQVAGHYFHPCLQESFVSPRSLNTAPAPIQEKS